MSGRALLVVSTALAAAALAGCGLGAGPTPAGVHLTVTRDSGSRVLHNSDAPHVVGEETVMSLLMRNDSVTTRYGGGFVQSIDGLSGGHERGEPLDWFYYVNGIEASQGAAQGDVHRGERIWWDLHDWSATDEIPAVVGSFPEPFLNESAGKRSEVRVECASLQSDPCQTVTARLKALAIPVEVEKLADAGAASVPRVLVGAWPALSDTPQAQSIEQGPAASGVYAIFAKSGHTLTLLNENGDPSRTLSAGAGLVAATRESEQAPVWVVTGTDASGVEGAAQALDQTELQDHFALAIKQETPIPVPLGAESGERAEL
jgi:hypothetical protein